MQIPFVKLHAAKNDFLLTRTGDAPAGDLPAIAIQICHRYTGVGADGWMLVDDTPGEGWDASIRLFNSDGSEPELSGNGTRCAAALLARDRPELTELRIRTGAGVKELRRIAADSDEYCFEMNMGTVAVEDKRATVQGRDAVLINPGNPQCAFPVDNFDFDWRQLGAATERDPRFPHRTNVSFFRKLDANTIEVRFWERGAGETMSSGTGSTGAAAAARVRGFVGDTVTVVTPAGPLQLRWASGVAFLTGPAVLVAEGVFLAHPVAVEIPRS